MDVALVQRIRGVEALTVWHGIHADTVNHNPPVTAGTTSTLSVGVWRSIWFISIPVEFRRGGQRDPVRWGQVGGAVLGGSSFRGLFFDRYPTGCQIGFCTKSRCNGTFLSK